MTHECQGCVEILHAVLRSSVSSQESMRIPEIYSTLACVNRWILMEIFRSDSYASLAESVEKVEIECGEK